MLSDVTGSSLNEILDDSYKPSEIEEEENARNEGKILSVDVGVHLYRSRSEGCYLEFCFLEYSDYLLPTTDTATCHGARESSSPETKSRKRRRKAQPDLWARNILKNKRSYGQEYVKRNSQVVKAKEPQQQNCSNCR